MKGYSFHLILQLSLCIFIALAVALSLGAVY